MGKGQNHEWRMRNMERAPVALCFSGQGMAYQFSIGRDTKQLLSFRGSRGIWRFSSSACLEFSSFLAALVCCPLLFFFYWHSFM